MKKKLETVRSRTHTELSERPMQKEGKNIEVKQVHNRNNTLTHRTIHWIPSCVFSIQGSISSVFKFSNWNCIYSFFYRTANKKETKKTKIITEMVWLECCECCVHLFDCWIRFQTRIINCMCIRFWFLSLLLYLSVCSLFSAPYIHHWPHLSFALSHFKSG